MFSTAKTIYDAERKIWSGPKKKVFYGPDMTLGEVALYVLSRHPEKIVQVSDSTGEQLVAAQLIQNGQSIARSLLHLGLRPGDVVGISASNTTYLSSVVLGALLCGTPTNALFPGFDKESVKIVFEVTTPKVIFCDVENYQVTKLAADELNLNAEIFLMNGEVGGVRNVKELLAAESSQVEQLSFPCEQLTGDDTAVILCSSGTTGKPKGVLCSHKALLNLEVFTKLTSDSVLFTFSTLYWASGLWTTTASILNCVQLIITDKPFSPEYFLHMIEKYRVTHMISGSHQIAQVIQNPDPNMGKRLASIKTVLCGGSKVPQVVAERMNAILGDQPRAGLAVAYGMSELSGMLSANDAGPGKRHEGTEGQLMPQMEVRVVDKATGELLGPNSPGILHIRTPYKWSGYYRNPEASKKAKADDWLVTSDIGFFDDDGFLHICTRDSDVFKSSSFQIYPEQIEEVLMQLPGVLEACVFGVPDLVAANLTACALVRANNEAGKKIVAADVVEYVSAKMAPCYHLRGGVFFVDSLPKTGSGKVQRRKVFETITSESK